MIAAEILFLYKGGRIDRIGSGEPFPSEFFYGARELASDGRSVAMLDEEQAAALAGADSARLPAGGVFGGFGVRLARAVAPMLPAIVASHLWSRAVRTRLAAASVIIATANGQAIALGALRRLGLLRRPVLAIAMGALLRSPTGWQERSIGWALRACRLVSLSKEESRTLSRWLGVRVEYLPFGVDVDFWTPGVGDPELRRTLGLSDGYVIAIGNDRHRDYRTLVAAWRPEFPTLAIITTLPLPQLPPNVRKIAGNWGDRLLSDAQVRSLIRDAAFAIVPLQATIQPSGQSAALQAMSCAKAVILSDIDGLWDRDMICDGVNCRLVTVGDANALAFAAAQLAGDVELGGRIGVAARKTVLAAFSARRMADELLALIEGEGRHG